MSITIEQIEQWHADDKHQKIVDAISAIPENERDFTLISLLGRALNNLDRESEALELLLSVKDVGAADALWNFRVGYSYYYLGKDAEAVPYFERAALLDDTDKDAKMFLRMALRDAGMTESGAEEEVEDPAIIAHATLTLNAKLQPAERAKIEDHIDELFKQQDEGCYVDGGGTLMAPDGGVQSCDIELALTRDDEQYWINTLRYCANNIAPKDSKLFLYDKDGELLKEAVVGKLEGLALYINGTDLPDEVYKTCDINHVVDETIRLMDDVFYFFGHWRGPTETALYYYGTSFGAMYTAIRGFIDEYPLCAQCRIEQVA